jgi:cyclic lactone autoinducer peptide
MKIYKSLVKNPKKILALFITTLVLIVANHSSSVSLTLFFYEPEMPDLLLKKD